MVHKMFMYMYTYVPAGMSGVERETVFPGGQAFSLVDLGLEPFDRFLLLSLRNSLNEFFKLPMMAPCVCVSVCVCVCVCVCVSVCATGGQLSRSPKRHLCTTFVGM